MVKLLGLVIFEVGLQCTLVNFGFECGVLVRWVLGCCLFVCWFVGSAGDFVWLVVFRCMGLVNSVGFRFGSLGCLVGLG